MMALGDIAATLPWPVFACDGEKRPIVRNGFKAATRDATTILRQFAAPSAAMIGVPTGHASGLVVVDVDIKNGAQGQAWLEEHADALPQTRTHKTRSGGLHLVFRAPPDVEIRNSAGRIAPGIDVRGEGGYIIAPPSPGYSVADPTEPADMPRWLIKRCLAPEPPPPTPDYNGPRTDHPYTRAALANECTRVASAGEGTRNHTLNLAALKLGHFVASGYLVRGEVIADLLAAAKAAGLPHREAEATIQSGLSAGLRTPKEPPEAPQRSKPSAAPYQQSYAQPDTPDAPNDTFPLQWFNDISAELDALDFVQGVLIEASAAVVYGESNSGKTFWATNLALHVAAGIEWSGRRVEQGGVIYCVLEGGFGFRNRVAAWKAAHDTLEGPVHFAAVQSAINLLDPAASTDMLIATIKAAAATIGMPVKLVVVDTLARALAGGNENAPEDMGALVMNMDRIRAETRAAVMFIHHSGKDVAKGARGHSSLRAAIDTEIEVVDNEGAVRVASVVKQRDLKKGDAFPFTLEIIEIGTNRHGEPVTTCLVKSDAEAYAGASLPRHRLPQSQQRALEVLADLVAASGQAGHAGTPAGIPSVPEKWWRERFYERAMPGAEQKAKEKAFRRAADALLSSHLAGMSAGRVWVVRHTTDGDNQAA